MKIYQYSSEEQARKIMLLQSIQGHEELLMKIFIEEGPAVLRQKLNLKHEIDWNALFDYLVFEHNVLKVCTLRFMDFFTGFVREKGPLALRKVFGIEHEMYDQIFEEIFDLVVISSGAIFDYVCLQKQEFLNEIKEGNGHKIRERLGLNKEKYNKIWQNVVDLLLQSFENQIVSERMLDQSLKSFSYLMNAVRTYRSIRKDFKQS